MKVVILAGGIGSRLSEETKLTPKPLIRIGKHPILIHIMNRYIKFKYTNFILCCGYKYVQFINYFKDNGYSIEKKTNKYFKLIKKDVSVEIVNTGKNTLTGDRILKIRKYLDEDELFFATYGDGVSNVNLKKLLKFHNNHKKIATLTAVNPPARFGAIKINNGLVSEFKEKIDNLDIWINGGFFIFNKKIFKILNKDNNTLEYGAMRYLSQKKQLMGYKHRGFWHPMDTLRDKNKLNNMWLSGKANWK